MKLLYLDFENGYKSLGSKETVSKTFGYPMIQYNSYKDFKSLLGKLFEKKEVSEVIKVGNLDIDQKMNKWVPKNGTSVDAIVLDTMTEMVKQFQRDLMGQRTRMQMQDWGDMKSELDRLMAAINGLPTAVICNVHGKLNDDQDAGVLKGMPNID